MGVDMEKNNRLTDSPPGKHHSMKDLKEEGEVTAFDSTRIPWMKKQGNLMSVGDASGSHREEIQGAMTKNRHLINSIDGKEWKNSRRMSLTNYEVMTAPLMTSLLSVVNEYKRRIQETGPSSLLCR